MKVLVTGVTGFLGGRVARRLADAGHDVRGFVRDRTRWVDRPEGAEVADGDLEALAPVRVAAEGCDAIVHAAALVRVWTRDRRDFDRVNVQGLSHVISAAAEQQARLVYVSSFFALGPTDGGIGDEARARDDTDFHTDYERTKWIGDKLARLHGDKGADLVRVYPGVVFGPGPLTEGNHVVHLLLQHARGKLPGYLGDGRLRQCFAFVDDVADGIVAALERGRAGDGYLLGGENRTARELFESFGRATGIAPPRRSIPFAVAGAIGLAQRLWADLTGRVPELTDGAVAAYRHEWAYTSAHAEAELGYRITPFDEAVARTVAALRESGELDRPAGEGTWDDSARS